MKKLLFLFLLVKPLSFIYAQDSASQNNQVFTIVQQMPKFDGGPNNYLSQHLVYPKEARDKGVEGTVFVTFVVEKDGSVTGARVLRGIEHSLDSEGVACISAMPKWSPGMQNGHPVRVQFNVPIHFSLVDAGPATDNTTNNSNTKDNAQDNSSNNNVANKGNASSEDKVYPMAEQMPKYSHLNDYLTQHVEYPKEAISKGVEGTVKVSFIVEKDGSLSNIHVLHSLEASLDSAAVTCLRNMPKWKPGMQNGKVVRVQFNTPVHFTLPDKEVPVAKTPNTTNKKTNTKPDTKEDNTNQNAAANAASTAPLSGLDTIYMNNEKIVCSVKEVTEDAVKYIYPGEETINTVFKNAIQKIVFRSGRVSNFAEATALKKVVCVDDYDNVSFSQAESEVKGLYKLGEVSSKAKGGSVYADMEKVKELAIFKLKIQAAMMGANVVLLTQEATSNSNVYNRYSGYNWYDNRYYTFDMNGGQTTATNMAGVAYNNVLPSYTDFEAKVNGRTIFNIVEETEFHINWRDYKTNPENGKFTITKLYNESGLIMITGFVDREQPDSFRVISFTDKYFIVMASNENATYNFQIKFKALEPFEILATLPLNSSRVFETGNGVEGTGTLRNLHNGSHPSLTV